MGTTLRAELKDLYSKNWDRILAAKRAITHGKPCGPFLIGNVEPYAAQKTKLMVIGQQTQWWEFSDEIDKQMAAHVQFRNGQRTPPEKPYHPNSPFSSVTRKLEGQLGIEHYACAYGNLNRFDIDGKKPSAPDEQAIAVLDDLLLEEISILKPEICVFFTGPHLDHRLRQMLSGLTFATIGDWTERQLCKLVHQRLPRHTFRTYHPNYLRRKKLEGTVISEIARYDFSAR